MINWNRPSAAIGPNEGAGLVPRWPLHPDGGLDRSGVFRAFPHVADTVGEFISGTCKSRFGLPSTPHLAQLPVKRPTRGIRRQYQLIPEPIPPNTGGHDTHA